MLGHHMATQRTPGAALTMVEYNAKVDASGMELWLRHTQVVLHHAHLCRRENLQLPLILVKIENPMLKPAESFTGVNVLQH